VLKPKRLQKLGHALRKALPTILTCAGAVGVVATVVLAVKATPKALEQVEADSRENHNGDPNAAAKLEVVKSCWKHYVPAAVTGAASLACFFSANALNRRQQVALTSAYTLVAGSYADYQRKLKEMYGKEAHEKIMASVAAERVDPDHTIYASGLLRSYSLDFEDADEEERLFYDSFSNRYFTSTIGKVLQAEYHLNRNFTIGGCVGVNNFYELLGIEDKKDLSDFGWWINEDLFWIDFDHSKVVLEDGMECYIIEMPFVPTNEPPD